MNLNCLISAPTSQAFNQDSEELQRRISYFPARTAQTLLQHQKHTCKCKRQAWMDMKDNKPYWKNCCTTSTSFYLMQSLLLLLCASPRVLQSTAWPA